MRTAPVLTVLTVLALVLTSSARAQGPNPDSIAVTLPEVQVTALRGVERVADVPAATFVVTKPELDRAGVARLATALQWLPGLYGYRQRGSGDVEVVDPRGFTASGESSYLKLLVNGQDVRGLENGDVDWDWLLPDDVERVEVVQGSGAWVYGDGSEGGIVNIVRPDLAQAFRAQAALRAGSFGLRSGSLSVAGGDDVLGGSAHGSARVVDGWRVRSAEHVYGGGGELSFPPSGGDGFMGGRAAGVTVSYLDADRQDPGTLTPEQIAADREQAENLYDFDHQKHGIASVYVQDRPGADPQWKLSGHVSGEDGDELRTLFLQPALHHTRAWTGGGRLDWRSAFGSPSRPIGVQAAIEAEQARLESEYASFDPGTGAGGRVADATSWRSTFAGSAGIKGELAPGTVARLDVRGDLARVHMHDDLADTSSDTRSLDALSALFGLNHALGASATAYASVSTAFRVPTLFQMFDQRPFFLGPGVIVTLSNRELDPQRSWTLEAGARCADAAGRSAAIALYTTRVRDEIDFDLATLQYANINESWHRGIELQAALPLTHGVTAHANGAWTPTTFVGGPYDGNQINGVPVSAGYVGVAWAPKPFGSVDLGVRLAGKQFMDKDELHPIPGFAVWDFGVEAHRAGIRGTLRVLNLFDWTYNDTGFIGGFGEERLSPAAPRGVTVSVGLD